jgi:tetratricopeptide (TPR) repeat protein
VRWLWLCVAAVVVVGMVSLGLLIVRKVAQPRVPVINLQQADSTVAGAIERCLEEARRNRGSGGAWGRLGALLRAYDYKAEAGRCLAEAERLEPREPRWPYFHGLLLLIDSPTEAIAYLRRAVELCGNEPEAPRYRLAKLLGEQGRWREARSELDQLLQAKPDFAPALLLAAQGWRAEGSLAEALRLGQRCTEDGRTARAAWALLAALHGQRGDSQAAASAARRSASGPPDEGFGDPFEAEAVALRGDPRALTEYAHPLLAAGRLSEASRLIERLRNEHPSYAETWLLMGRLQFLRKEVKPAEESFRRHLELHPRSVQGYFQLGMTLLEQKRFSEAAEAFLVAARIKPDFGPAHFNRGIALARAGWPSAAMAAFQEAIRHNPEHLESYLLLADLHLQAGDRAKAAKLLNQAGAIKPDDRHLQQLRRRLSE